MREQKSSLRAMNANQKPNSLRKIESIPCEYGKDLQPPRFDASTDYTSLTHKNAYQIARPFGHMHF